MIDMDYEYLVDNLEPTKKYFYVLNKSNDSSRIFQIENHNGSLVLEVTVNEPIPSHRVQNRRPAYSEIRVDFSYY